MSPASRVPGRARYFGVSLILVVLDQLTKILAHAYLPGRGPVEIIPDFFNLAYSRNPGGLFGYFSDLADPWRAVLLTLFPLLAIGMIAWFLLHSRDVMRGTLFGMALILGGAVGNLIDRIFRGEVVDFLDVYAAWPRVAEWLEGRFGTAHWPTFNLADSGIVVGACLLMIDIVRPQRTPAARAPADSPAAADPGESR